MKKIDPIQSFWILCLGFVLLFPLHTKTTLNSNWRNNSQARPVEQVERLNPISEKPAFIRGQITDRVTGLSISGAMVTIQPLLEHVTPETDGESWPYRLANGDGEFTLPGISLHQAELPITVTISAPGYGDWALRNVRLIAGDTLIITARLSERPYTDTVPPPLYSNLSTQMLDEPSLSLFLDRPNTLINSLPLNHVTVPRPEFIRVRVSGYPYNCDTSREYSVEVVPFNEYVRHVLPNEWGATWPADSLRAGAMAVKMYAWSVLSLGYKWSDADVWDSTCDQVYNPNFEYTSTNDAVNFIWDWVLGKDDLIFHTSYRAYYSQCVDAKKEGRCMGQWESKEMAMEGKTWEEILYFFYLDSELLPVTPRAITGYQLQFYGSPGDNTTNRVLLSVDDPENHDPGPPVDVGKNDFTLEWWLKASATDNSAPAIACGTNDNWQNGNVLFDRTRLAEDRGYGVSLNGGRVVFGVSGDGSGDYSLCGTTPVTDNLWHHIAVERRRSDGLLWLYVDGQLEASAAGPTGDISYPDDYETDQATDPFLSIGAWKLPDDHTDHPFFRGHLDELRFSSRLRYLTNFQPSVLPFVLDDFTLALFHFEEGVGNLVLNSTGGTEGIQHGNRKYGGAIDGPVWQVGEPFLLLDPGAYIPLIRR